MPLKFSELGQRQKPSEITRLMTIALERPEVLSLAAGFTDNQTLPLEDVLEIVSSMGAKQSHDKSVLQYGTNQGNESLRSLLARRIENYDSQSENECNESNIFVTNGSQQALYLAMQTLCDPGDIVLVEQPTYFVFLEILHGLGIRALPMPVDAATGKIDVDGLGNLIDGLSDSGELDRLKGMYLVTYYSNPSGRSMTQNTKRSLGSLVRREGLEIAVIEDAAYRDLYFREPFDGSSVLALPEFEGMSVFYSSTLTKPFATGLKVGYGYCRDQGWLSKMLTVKGQHDFGTSNFAQTIMEIAVREGRFDRNLNTLRQSYEKKMLALNGALEGSLRALGWKWDIPEGGLYLWLNAPAGMETGFESDFHARCVDEGVIYVPGSLCHGLGEPKDRIRLSYGVLGADELKVAAGRFCRAAASI